jgi:hypothetical protein
MMHWVFAELRHPRCECFWKTDDGVAGRNDDGNARGLTRAVIRLHKIVVGVGKSKHGEGSLTLLVASSWRCTTETAVLRVSFGHILRLNVALDRRGGDCP